MLNKNYTFYKVLGIISIIVLVLFIGLNVMTYSTFKQFGDENGAERIEFGYFDNKELSKKYLNGEFSTTNFEYKESIAKFYVGDEDIVVTKNLHVAYNDMNNRIATWIQSFTMIGMILFISSVVSLFTSFGRRHFPHGNYATLIAGFVFVFADMKYVLNPFLTTLVMVCLIASVYFYANTRFYDFNENRYLSIFDKKKEDTITA